MITTAIVSWMWSYAGGWLERIPDVEIATNGVTASVMQYLRAALYFLPVNTFVSIIQIVLVLWLFRIGIAVLHSLWAALPIV